MKNNRMLKMLVSIFFILGLNVSVFATNTVSTDNFAQNIKTQKGLDKEEFALYSFLYKDRVVINVKRFSDANVAVGKYKIAVKNGSLNLLRKYEDVVNYLKINNINNLEKIIEPDHFKQILELILKNYKLDEDKLKAESENFKGDIDRKELQEEQKNLQLKIKNVTEILNNETYFEKARQNYYKYVKEADIIDKINFEKELNEILTNNNVKMNNGVKILEIEQGQGQELTFYRFLSTDMMDINVRRFSEDANCAVERHKTIVRNGVLNLLRKYDDVMKYFKTNNINNIEKIIEPGHFKKILELILKNYKLDEDKLKAKLENLRGNVITDEIKIEYKKEKQKRIDDLRNMLNLPLKNKEKEDIEKEKIRKENLKNEIVNLENNLENFEGDVFKEFINSKKISLECELNYLQLNRKHLGEILNGETYFEKARQNYLECVKEADKVDKTNFENDLNKLLTENVCN